MNHGNIRSHDTRAKRGDNPLRLDVRGDAWWVYFDTPGSSVNIFTQAAAESVLEVSERAQRQGPEAVIFASDKEKSFINGAQLMMASAVQSCHDVFPLTDLLRQAYRSVRELDMLTVAAVQGSCYGCGVEFTLNCDHRLVADSGHTQFYMTELADYLNTPAFGSTQRLVRKMPLPAAVDFLMWARRLRAAEAVAGGLASASLAWQGFEERATSMVNDILSGRFESPSPAWLNTDELKDYQASIWNVIEGLPPDYQPIHRDCFQLMLHAKKKPSVEPEDERLELEACGRSLVEPAAQLARSVLFVRQLAERVCVRRPPAPQDLAFVLDRKDSTLAGLRQEFVEQNHPRSRVVDSLDELSEERVAFRFHPLDAPEHAGNSAPKNSRDTVDVASSTGICRRLSAEGPPVIFHRPAPGLKAWDETKVRPRGGATMLIELAVFGEKNGGDQALNLLFDYLTDFDAAVIYSRPRDYFASDYLAMAYLAPLAAFLASGGSISTVRRSLHDFGFLQMPWEWSDFVEPSPQLIQELSRRISAHFDDISLQRGLEVLLQGDSSADKAGEVDEVLVDALLLSLLQAVGDLLDERVLAHVALADVVACELLGFPITRGTLCQFMTTKKVSQAMKNRAGLKKLVAQDVLQYAETFQQEERGHYG